MFASVNWLHIIFSGAAGFTVSMIFYFLPIMQKVRGEQDKNLTSAILMRLWNTMMYAFAFAWILSLTKTISPVIMGVILLLVGTLRAAFTPDGWNRDMIGQPRAVRMVDNARFILMYLVMTGVLIFWK